MGLYYHKHLIYTLKVKEYHTRPIADVEDPSNLKMVLGSIGPHGNPRVNALTAFLKMLLNVLLNFFVVLKF